jgi:glycosyltransferase involved in cell wall biosynthesis
VVPVWGGYDEFLDESLPGLLEQEEVDEVIVVDNASATEVAHDDERVVIVRSGTRLSCGAARNLGLEHVRSPLVVMWDADDLMLPGSLAFLSRPFAEAPDLVAHAAAILDPPGQRHRWPYRSSVWLLGRHPRLFAFLNSMWSQYPTTGATVMRTEVVRQAGGYPDAESAEDWGLGASLVWRGRVAWSERPGRVYRKHDRSVLRRHSTVNHLLEHARAVRSLLRADAAVPAWCKRALPLMRLGQYVVIFGVRPLLRTRRSISDAGSVRAPRDVYNPPSVKIDTRNPLVSVVLPTRDRAGTLGRAIESVLSQSYQPLELLVVDDGSRDGTREVLESYGASLTVLPQERRGAYAARNLGVAEAKGELVAFIDSDDMWYPDRLASQVPLMKGPEVGLVFGDALHVSTRPGPSANRSTTCFDTTPPRRGSVADHFTWGNFVPTTTVLVRRSCLEQVGGFPTSHEVSADYLTWFRIALRHQFEYVDCAVAAYLVHPGGISSDLGRSLEARIELFSAERARTHDPALRRLLDQVVFNLGLHLAVAAARGRASSVDEEWRLVRAAVRLPRGRRAVRMSGSFASHHLRARARRALHAAPRHAVRER